MSFMPLRKNAIIEKKGDVICQQKSEQAGINKIMMLAVDM